MVHDAQKRTGLGSPDFYNPGERSILFRALHGTESEYETSTHAFVPTSAISIVTSHHRRIKPIFSFSMDPAVKTRFLGI